MNPLVLNDDITTILPSPEVSPPHDLICFDPRNDVHVLAFGATSMLLAAMLVFFCINFCRANSLHGLQTRMDREQASSAHRIHELKREVSHLRRDLCAVQFQETEVKIDRILQRAQSPSSPLFHLKAWEKGSPSGYGPTAPPMTGSSSGSLSSGSPSRGQLYRPSHELTATVARVEEEEPLPHLINGSLPFRTNEFQRECARISQAVEAYPFTDQQPSGPLWNDEDMEAPVGPSMIAAGGDSLIAAQI